MPLMSVTAGLVSAVARDAAAIDFRGCELVIVITFIFIVGVCKSARQ